MIRTVWNQIPSRRLKLNCKKSMAAADSLLHNAIHNNAAWCHLMAGCEVCLFVFVFMFRSITDYEKETNEAPSMLFVDRNGLQQQQKKRCIYVSLAVRTKIHGVCRRLIEVLPASSPMPAKPILAQKKKHQAAW